MTRSVLAVLVLMMLAICAGAAVAQTPAPRPVVPPEQASALPAPPAEVALPVAAEQQPARPTPAPSPMKQKMVGGMMPPPALGKWWKDSGIVNELKLTPEQINQLEKAFFDHRLKLITLNANLQVAETQLEALLDTDRPEEAKVSAQIDQVTQARGNLEKENAMMMLGVRRVLSVEQWKRLQEIQQFAYRKLPPPPPPPAPPAMEAPARKPAPPAGEKPPALPTPAAPRQPGS